jgi:membrane associated rhomboid family serine protease
VTWLLLAVNVGFFLLLEAAGGSEDGAVLVRYGAKYGPLIADGEYWRLVVPVFMHIGAFHLIANSVGLLVFGGIVERAFGWPAFAVIYLAAGIAGNVASYAAGPTVGAGASGAIFGLVGAFGVYLYQNRAALGRAARGSLGGLALIIGINVVFGLSTPGVDNWAHFGGIVAGAAMALRLAPRVGWQPVYGAGDRPLGAVPRSRRAEPVAVASAAVAAAIMVVFATVLIARTYPDRTSTFAASLSGQAIEALLDNRLDDARRLARQAERTDPSSEHFGIVYLILGAIALERGQTPEARGYFRLALERNLPPDAEALAQRELARLGG